MATLLPKNIYKKRFCLCVKHALHHRLNGLEEESNIHWRVEYILPVPHQRVHPPPPPSSWCSITRHLRILNLCKHRVAVVSNSWSLERLYNLSREEGGKEGDERGTKEGKESEDEETSAEMRWKEVKGKKEHTWGEDGRGMERREKRVDTKSEEWENKWRWRKR